jgi:anaerobic magnesium-protoporphyrin IX monomethyl ester cyclase
VFSSYPFYKKYTKPQREREKPFFDLEQKEEYKWEAIMRVLLINPPVRMPPGLNLGTDNSAQSFPIGLLYLAGALVEAGHRVSVYDCAVEPSNRAAIIATVNNTAPDLVGITATTPSFRNAVATSAIVKEIFPGVPVVLGGQHATLFSRRILMEIQSVDIVCRGEGEHTICEIADGRPLDMIAGLSFRGNGKIQETSDRPLLEDLDGVPFPARHLVGRNRYGSMGGVLQMADPRRYTSLITSRGCPYGCRYCCVSAYSGRRYRIRRVDRIESEVQTVLADGLDQIYIQDDNFTIHRYLPEICEMLSHYPVTWFCLGRADTPTEYYRRMVRAGCRAIYFGVESFSPRVLAYFAKETSPEKIVSAIRGAKAAGLEVLVSLILGAPVEQPEDIELNKRMLTSLDIDAVELNVLTYFPFTPIWEEVDPLRVPWDRELLVTEVHPGVTERRVAEAVSQLKMAFYGRRRYLVRQLWRTLTRRRDLLRVNLGKIPAIVRFLLDRHFGAAEVRGKRL